MIVVGLMNKDESEFRSVKHNGRSIKKKIWESKDNTAIPQFC